MQRVLLRLLVWWLLLLLLKLLDQTEYPVQQLFDQFQSRLHEGQPAMKFKHALFVYLLPNEYHIHPIRIQAHLVCSEVSDLSPPVVSAADGCFATHLLFNYACPLTHTATHE